MPFKGSNKLKKEIHQWLDEGIIDEQQASVLQKRYALDAPAPWFRRTSFILRAVAALLFGLALLLIISENWQDFGLEIQSAIGIIPLLSAYTLGTYYMIKGKREAAELTFFFACLAFGANIFLQAQIFHISNYYPNGLLWWMIGTMPFVWFFRSKLINFQLQALFMIWICAQFNYDHFHWVALPIWAFMGWLLYLKKPIVQFLVFLLNTYVLIFNLNQYISHKTEGFVLFATISLVIAVLLQFLSKKGNTNTQRLFALMNGSILFVLYLYTFHEIVENLDLRIFPVTSVGLLFIALLLLIKTPKSGYLLWAIGIAGWLVASRCIPLLLPQAHSFYDGTVVVISNMLFVAYIVWLITKGIRTQNKEAFLGGVFLILLLMTSRYFDLFHNYLVTALIFGCSGIILLIANQFWKKRYEL